MAHVHDLAADARAFKRVFATAWRKAMVADRFDGPVKRVC